MYERDHHQRIAYLLGLLDSTLLRECRCWFGGGTAIALRFGEFRESRDIDFLVSDVQGYGELRRRLTGPGGVKAAFSVPSNAIPPSSGLRADRYGVRTQFEVAGANIKFEIVLEGNIELETPGPADQVCGVTTLVPIDMAATKLMANADRWADDGTFNRDLIDLAMIELSRRQLRNAVEKAQAVYGRSIIAGLEKAVKRLQEREGWMERCLELLEIRLPRAALWERIRRLRTRVTTE